MTEHTLKSSTGATKTFNRVRKEKSRAHDNPTLDSGKDLLIFTHVCRTVRFIELLEARAERAAADAER